MTVTNEGDKPRIREAMIARAVRLGDGTLVPPLGQGTWFVGDDPARRRQEMDTLRAGIELGMSLIDTAEMYGEGAAESLVGEAIRGIRDDVFLVSKVYPHNAGLKHMARSCEQSLRRLGTDRIDLYLLHWRGSIPLSETVEAMERLVEAGKIARWGVSNLDTADMLELSRLAKGTRSTVNQVLYHLGSRGIEFDLLPWQRERHMPVMAYSPLAQAGTLRRGLADNAAVVRIAERRGITPYQLLLAWCIRSGDVIAIPKASTVEHVRMNAAAALVELTEEDLQLLDGQFPKPTRKVALDMT